MAGIMPTIAAPPRRARGPYEVIAANLRQQIEDGRTATHGVSIATSHRAQPTRLCQSTGSG
jgi:hypothetical protein